MDFRIHHYRDISKTHIEDLVALIKSGEQVAKEAYIRRGLLRSEFIAIGLKQNEVIVSVTLKNPLVSYVTRVFTAAGTQSLAANYSKELGYIVTKPQYEGQGLCQALLRYVFAERSVSKAFATTRKEAMCHILEKFDFQKTGDVHGDLQLMTKESGVRLAPLIDFSTT